MAGVSIRIEGSEEVGRRLAATAARLEHPRALWEQIGNAGQVQTQLRFEREQDPDGKIWPRSIRSLLTGGKTLSNSGDLKNKISYEASDTGVAIGSNAIYAAIHQFGGRIEAKTPAGLMFRIAGQWVRKHFVDIPRRAFLGISPDDAEAFIEKADEYVADPLGGAGAA